MAKKSQSPAGNAERYTRIETAWTTLAPNATFGKMTPAQFITRIQPSKNKRQRIAELEDELKNLIAERDTDDKETLKACDEVVKGVVGDPDYGDNCGLYGSMGYIRKSERQSGLTRKKAEDKAD